MAKPMDRKGKRSLWEESRRAESHYNTRLRQVARHIGAIVKGFAPEGVVKDLDALDKMLSGYATLLRPWASSVAAYMIADVNRRNERVWKTVSKEMGAALRQELQHGTTGMLHAGLMNEQVELIQSLPIKAAERVHRLTTEAMLTSTRASEVAKEIMRTTQVTEARATLIARTEVSRTAVLLTQARAQFAGSPRLYLANQQRRGGPPHPPGDGGRIRAMEHATKDGCQPCPLPCRLRAELPLLSGTSFTRPLKGHHASSNL